MSTAPAIRAYLGGSFNPVHNSHIQMAMHVFDCLTPIAAEQQRVLQVSLLPNARSPFKEQSLDPAHRLAMLTLAIQDTPLQVSELELWQSPPVYTIDSVRTLRKRYPNDSLIFIMGMDSARSLEQWKDGLQLTDYVHLWIFDRDNNVDYSLENNTNNITQHLSSQNIAHLYNEVPAALQGQITHTPTDLTQPLNELSETSQPLKNTAQGRIYIDPRPLTAVSSTQIRQQLQICNTTTDNQPSSVTKWLNPTVYRYIITHQLYSAV
ncbi:nicotinate (nicotinamide) nucleotide adenylyltransferase [Psychrobacter frigidicola]|uniref:Probable nicotinate-nucleotide adenylyltransferase n=1 Tax=Psychrobacter frigidicola TaxID=45611 RepID=A0A5C7A886_9GAMM|nr:nicotinate (nicotinamide) nucleotide adenylyltransferase [Psychrobacter frigidicola]TXD96970.1 nicotinate (nicotinamide) nucleotide adenylyltransferase [Psychrobacter frigidicola]